MKCEFSMHKKYSNVGLCMKEESNQQLYDFLHKLQSKVRDRYEFFFKDVSYVQQGYINLINNTVETIIL